MQTEFLCHFCEVRGDTGGNLSAMREKKIKHDSVECPLGNLLFTWMMKTFVLEHFGSKIENDNEEDSRLENLSSILAHDSSKTFCSMRKVFWEFPRKDKKNLPSFNVETQNNILKSNTILIFNWMELLISLISPCLVSRSLFETWWKMIWKRSITSTSVDCFPAETDF